jgi:hypothetical protein
MLNGHYVTCCVVDIVLQRLRKYFVMLWNYSWPPGRHVVVKAKGARQWRDHLARSYPCSRPGCLVLPRGRCASSSTVATLKSPGTVGMPGQWQMLDARRPGPWAPCVEHGACLEMSSLCPLHLQPYTRAAPRTCVKGVALACIAGMSVEQPYNKRIPPCACLSGHCRYFRRAPTTHVD